MARVKVTLPQAGKEYSHPNEAETRRLLEAGFDQIGAEVAAATGYIFNETLTFHSEGGWAFEFTACPLGVTYWSLFKRPWYDCSNYTLVRLCVDIMTVGVGGTYLRLQWSQTPDDDASWATASSIGEVDIPIYQATGPQRSTWFPLVSQAIGDVCWRVVTVDGDGAASPVLGYIKAEFTRRPARAVERWYFRDLVPAYDALTDLGVYGTDITPPTVKPPNYWAPSGYNATYEPFKDPTPAAHAAAPLSLLREKGSAGVSAEINAENDPTPPDLWYYKSADGPYGRFVSPPLAAQYLYGQRVRAGLVLRDFNGSSVTVSRLLMYVVRPGVGPLYRVEGFLPNSHVPLSARQMFVELDLVDFRLADNDRIVVDIWGYSQTQGVVLGQRIGFQFDGTDDNFVDTAFAGASSASFIELPLLKTLADTA